MKRVCIIGVLLLSFANAGLRVYEKPEKFIQRWGKGQAKQKLFHIDGTCDEQVQMILGHSYTRKNIKYWQKGALKLWILEEIGKHEPITVGLAIEGGKVKELKVLLYRESHGWEVSNSYFLKRFRGRFLKKGKLDKRVGGLQGATLSVRALSKLSNLGLYFSKELDAK